MGIKVSRLTSAAAFVRLGRPHFLVGGFVLYALGAAVAVTSMPGGGFDARAYWLGQAAITAIQLMTHYANDYFDFAADAANRTPTRFSGGSRVLPSGALSRGVARTAALVLGALGLCLSLVIAVIVDSPRGWQTAGVLVLAEALAWTYSAPPLQWHSRGLGELTTAVVVTGLTPLAGYRLQSTMAWGLAAGGGVGGLRGAGILLFSVMPLAALQLNMLLMIELPDAAGDAAVGKRTLVVRLGPRVAAALSRMLLVAVYGGLPLWVHLGLPGAVALACGLGLPLAAWQFWRLGQGAWATPQRWGGLATGAVGLLLGTSTAELSAFAWLLLSRR